MQLQFKPVVVDLLRYILTVALKYNSYFVVVASLAFFQKTDRAERNGRFSESEATNPIRNDVMGRRGGD